MNITVKQIAKFIQGEISGNEEIAITSVSKIEEGMPGSLTFLANPAYTKYIYTTKASVVIVNNDFKPDKIIGATLIYVKDAYQAFAKLLEIYKNMSFSKKGIEHPNYISESAVIGEDIYIGAFAYIGDNVKIGNKVKLFPHVYLGDNVTVGDGTVLHSGVKVYNNCVINSNCIIHSGAIIGSDGFGFAPKGDNDYKKVPQVGNVIIEDDVEIGSHTTIDRATIGSTIIRKGVKLDNLIQVAHNVEIGENTVIAAQSGISGSTKLGKNCMIGGQVGVIGHLKIADGVKIAAQSGIGKDIKNEGEIVQGSPAFGVRDYQKSYIVYRRLPELREQLIDLERRIKEIENQ